jgi:DNA modification methylase
VTSPPYFGLRDYGCAGQIGLESTPDAYVAELVAVFRECKRILRDDGTLWVNIGDSYAGSGGAGGDYSKGGLKEGQPKWKSNLDAQAAGLKSKDLIGIPWMLAFALRADGWYLRQDIIWHKPNPMPESVRDRCTKAHEYLFLLSKAPRYYYDADEMREEAIHSGRVVKASDPASAKNGQKGKFGATALGFTQHDTAVGETRNRRDVWTVATKPYKEAHFATFPPDLIRPCIRAGCPAGGTVLDPFGGSGTTGEVAASEGRKAILIELNPEYVKLAKNRGGLFYTSNPNFQAGGTL